MSFLKEWWKHNITGTGDHDFSTDIREEQTTPQQTLLARKKPLSVDTDPGDSVDSKASPRQAAETVLVGAVQSTIVSGIILFLRSHLKDLE